MGTLFLIAGHEGQQGNLAPCVEEQPGLRVTLAIIGVTSRNYTEVAQVPRILKGFSQRSLRILLFEVHGVKW